MLPDCFSYKTRPNLSLLEALYISCSLPLIFQPTYYDNTYYIDYGIIENNPYNLNMDTENEEIDKERVLSINMRNTFLKHEINNESTFIEYLLYFLKNILNKYQKPSKKHKNELKIFDDDLSLNTLYDLVNKKETRSKIIQQGEKYGKLFIDYKNNQ